MMIKLFHCSELILCISEAIEKMIPRFMPLHKKNMFFGSQNKCIITIQTKK